MTTIMELLDNELEIANTKYLQFQSLHEAYSITLEEFEETKEVIDRLNVNMVSFWQACRNDKYISDEDILDIIVRLRNNVYSLISEAVQVGAMANKTISFVQNKRDK